MTNGGTPTIISCAVTGGADNAHMNPAIPVTPEQIADEALAARAAGAAVVHIHVRDPATGKPSRKLELYREVVARIRDSGSDVVINLTTGPGARLQPDDAGQPGPGTTLVGPEERVEHVLALRPDICSLDVATMNFGAHAMVNVPSHLETMARLIRDAGVKPELEVFDLGHVALARRMIEQGRFAAPPLLQLCMGVPWGAPATPEAVLAMRAGLLEGAVWSTFGISRHQFPTVALALRCWAGTCGWGWRTTCICPAACWRLATGCWWSGRRRWCAASARKSRRRRKRGRCSGWGRVRGCPLLLRAAPGRGA